MNTAAISIQCVLALLALPGAAGSTAPTSQPQSMVVTVKAVQGTAGAPAPAGDEATLFVADGPGSIRRFAGRLDGSGSAEFRFELTGPAVAAAVVVHDGVEYQRIVSGLTPSEPRANIEVTVFESAAIEPDWTLQARRVSLSPASHGVAVSERIWLNNPADRTWPGRLDHGERTAFEIEFPSAEGVQTSSPGDRFGRDGVLRAGDPVTPGQSVRQVRYSVPRSDGCVVLVAPRRTESLTVDVPDDARVWLSGDGVGPGRVVENEHGQRVVRHELGPQTRSRRVAVNLHVLSADRGGRYGPAQLLAAAGAACVLAGGVVAVVRNPTSQRGERGRA